LSFLNDNFLDKKTIFHQKQMNSAVGIPVALFAIKLFINQNKKGGTL
jgi:hypothetical protein